MVSNHDESLVIRALKSVRESISWEIEVILIDDRNTLDSYNLSEFYECYHRVLLFKNYESSGLTKGLNFASAVAKGKYLARLDADDLCEPDRMFLQLQLMELNPSASVCFSDAFVQDSSGNFPPTLQKINCLAVGYKNSFVHSSAFIRRADFIQNGGYRYWLKKKQDFELWHRLQFKNFKFINCDRPLIVYTKSRKKPFVTNLWVIVVHSYVGMKYRRFIPHFFYSLSIFTRRIMGW